MGPQFGLDVGQVGGVFAGFALVSVVLGTPLATFSDKVGKHRALTLGAGLIAVPMAALPMLNSGFSDPNSLLSDYASPAQRGQALSIMRTSSDLGYLVGAFGTGYFADCFGTETALVSLGIMMAATSAWFGRAAGAGRGTKPLRDVIKTLFHKGK